MSQTTPHKVIYDTDPGVDDAMALYFALAHPAMAQTLAYEAVAEEAAYQPETPATAGASWRFVPAAPAEDEKPRRRSRKAAAAHPIEQVGEIHPRAIIER